MRIELDSGSTPKTPNARLRQIEIETRDNGHRRIELLAALARGRLRDDKVHLAEVRDRASQHGFARLALQAARSLSS